MKILHQVGSLKETCLIFTRNFCWFFLLNLHVPYFWYSVLFEAIFFSACQFPSIILTPIRICHKVTKPATQEICTACFQYELPPLLSIQFSMASFCVVVEIMDEYYALHKTSSIMSNVWPALGSLQIIIYIKSFMNKYKSSVFCCSNFDLVEIFV